MKDLKFLALKDLLFSLQCIEFQGADSILKVDFALSSRPHLHRAYEVTVCNQIWIAVNTAPTVCKKLSLLYETVTYFMSNPSPSPFFPFQI